MYHKLIIAYVSKFFAMLEVAQDIISKSVFVEKHVDEIVLTIKKGSQSFLCEKHLSKVKFVNNSYVIYI